MRQIFYGGTLLTGGGEVFSDAYLIEENGRISEIGNGPPPVEENPQNRKVSFRDKILLPGLINTHGHAAMSLLRGYADDLALKEWLEKKMWPIEDEFTPSDIYWGSALAVLEMIKSGTSCFADMYVCMEQVATVVEEAGLRASLARGVIGHGSESEIQEKIRDMRDFARQYRQAAGGRITTMVSPHSAYTCSPETIAKISDVASEFSLPVHIHLSETEEEVAENLSRFGKRPVQHLCDIGLFDHPALAAHVVHVNQHEIELLAQHQVRVSHNPGSNLKLASGIAPVPEMLAENIVVSLGTDSAASNNNLDMFEEMRLAALIHKGYRQDPLAVPAETALQMATINGALSLGIAHETGSLEVGKSADFIIVKTREPHWQPLYEPVSHLVYTARAEDVTNLYVCGKPLMQNRDILTMDEEKILYEVNRIIKKWT